MALVHGEGLSQLQSRLHSCMERLRNDQQESGVITVNANEETINIFKAWVAISPELDCIVVQCNRQRIPGIYSIKVEMPCPHRQTPSGQSQLLPVLDMNQSSKKRYGPLLDASFEGPGRPSRLCLRTLSEKLSEAPSPVTQPKTCEMPISRTTFSAWMREREGSRERRRESEHHSLVDSASPADQLPMRTSHENAAERFQAQSSKPLASSEFDSSPSTPAPLRKSPDDEMASAKNASCESFNSESLERALDLSTVSTRWKLNGGEEVLVSPEVLALENSMATYEAETAYRVFQDELKKTLADMDAETLSKFRDGKYLQLLRQRDRTSG